VRKVFRRHNICSLYEFVDTSGFCDPFNFLYFDPQESEIKAKNIAKLKSAIKERVYSTDANIKSEMEKIVDEYIRYYIPESIANSIQALHTEKPPLEENKEIEVDSVSEENACDVDTEINGRLSGTKVEDVLESVKSKKPENIPLFKDSNGDGIVYKGQTSLLYSDPKVGKTLFSIEIAKSNEIKKPLFILLDDISDRQRYRYESLISNKQDTKLITEDRWKEKKEIIKKEMQEKNKEQAMQNVMWEHFVTTYSAECVMDMQKEIKKLNKESGIEETTLLNDFLVLERIMNEAVSDSVDFIYIDTLRGLMGKTIILNYAILNKIINIPSKNNITTLLLHHTNKDNEVATTKDLERIVDNIYQLSKDESSNDSGKSYLVIKTESRFGPNPLIKIERTISDDAAVVHTIISIDNNPKTLNKKETFFLNDRIKDVILNYDQSEIVFDVLVEEIHQKNGNDKDTEKSIINILPALRKEGLIKMTDGKTWRGGITIIKAQDLFSEEIVAETTTNT
jgi:predicted ATP-dependent serine protease